MSLEMSPLIQEEDMSALIKDEGKSRTCVDLEDEKMYASVEDEVISASSIEEEMSASIERKDELKEFLINIKERVEPIQPASKCCIYRVPEDIRRTKIEAYTPQLISIGPLHYGKKELADTEKKKESYVKSFLHRISAESMDKSLDAILTFVRNKEQDIRDCYAETIKFETPEFVRMITCDAIFIIEHFLRSYFAHRNDSLPHVPALTESVVDLDLILLENQLPYFVLEGIYKVVTKEDSFSRISNSNFEYMMFGMECQDREVKHFTDLIRTALVKDYPKEGPKGEVRDLPCAGKLHKSGVKFRSTGGHGFLDIRFEERERLVPWLKVHELQIPCLTVYDDTECLLRNVIALEQCHYPSDTLVCNYVWFMDCLIDTEKDVELLVAGGIISNVVGDDAKLANIFNNLTSNLVLDDYSSYHNICKKLKAHYENPSNRHKASLKTVYFRDLWTGTATIAAGILLLLTVIQTICSIMQVT